MTDLHSSAIQSEEAARLARALRPAQRPLLDPGLHGAEAFVQLARACAARIAETTAAFLTNDDPATTHQLRVALRRHRTLLKLFAPHLAPAFVETHRAEARRLGAPLGALREAEVMALETLPALRESVATAASMSQASVSEVAMSQAAKSAETDATEKATRRDAGGAQNAPVGEAAAAPAKRRAGRKTAGPRSVKAKTAASTATASKTTASETAASKTAASKTAASKTAAAKTAASKTAASKTIASKNDAETGSRVRSAPIAAPDGARRARTASAPVSGPAKPPSRPRAPARAADFAALSDTLLREAAQRRAALRQSAFGAEAALYLIRFEQDLVSESWRAPEAARCKKSGPSSVKFGAKFLDRRAERLARAALSRAAKALARWGARMEDLDVEERHEMRKKAKVLRYAVEFFGSLFPETEVKPYRRTLKKLQASFGSLNDAADVAKLRELSVKPTMRPAIEAAIAESEARMRREFPVALARWRALESAAPFWA